MTPGRICACLIALASTQAIPAQASETETLVERVRDANARFADATIAVAEGYERQPCVSGARGGAMGVHSVNADYLRDDGLDAARPEALIYEPQPGGGVELVGAEFITHSGPAVLDGHLLHYVGAPNCYGLCTFYELHVWAWRDNPSGAFADFNPAVSCKAQLAEGGGTGG